VQAQTLNALDLGQLQTLRASAHREEAGALRKSAQQFEALFTQMMLKSMRDALPGDSSLGSQGDMYQGMYDQQLSLSLAGGKGMGLADMLVRQLSQGRPDLADPASTSTLQAPRQASARLAATAQGETAVVPAGLPAVRSLRQLNAYSAFAGTLPLDTAPDSGWTEQQLAMLNAAALTIDEKRAAASAASTKAGATADNWEPGDAQGFIDAIRPHAERAARELGVPTRAVLAQAALETGWGRHVARDEQGQPSYNLSGIKATRSWNGERINASTQEFRDGSFGTEQADFRGYKSLSAAFDDYVSFLKDNPRYLQALRSEGVEGFASGLQRAGYATDPGYAQKLVRVAYGRDMNQALTAPGAEVGF